LLQAIPIHDLSNTNATACDLGKWYHSGISTTSCHGFTGYRNNIHSLSTLSPTSGMAGIFCLGAGGYSPVINNFIRLGIDGNGANVSVSSQINGIYKAASVSQNISFNTVYIGGLDVNSGTVNTYAFRRSASGPADAVMNNIFFNARSNATGTGKHYATFLNANNALISNHNDLFVNGTGGVLGLSAATDYATLAAWVAATSQDGASISSDPRLVNPVRQFYLLLTCIFRRVLLPVSNAVVTTFLMLPLII
jgi:hypothetical protein